MVNRRGNIPNDLLLKYSFSLLWCVLGILGYALNDQYRGLKDRIASLEAEEIVCQSFQSAFTAKAEVNFELIKELRVSQFELEKEFNEMHPIVSELLEIRREERQTKEGKR